MKFEELIPLAYEAAKSKGFYAGKPMVGEWFMAVVGECGEAMDAHRKGRRADLSLFKDRLEANGAIDPNMALYERYVKNTFEDELADVMLCTASMCGALNLKVCERKGWNGQQEMNVGEQLLYVVRCLTRATANGYDIVDAEDVSNAVTQVRRLAYHMEVDLDLHIQMKMFYNTTRQHMHGKLY